MKKLILFVLFSCVLAPSLALASWWNPFTWFTKVEPVPVVQQVVPIVIPAPVAPAPLPVVKKVTPKEVVKKNPIKSSVAGCVSTTGYSLTTGLSCSGDNSCTSGSFKYKGVDTCMTPLAYCQSTDGADATYNSDSNTCIIASNQTGSQICGATFSNSTWDGTYTSSGNYSCGCISHFQWNKSGTACEYYDSSQDTYVPSSTSTNTVCSTVDQDVRDEITKANGFATESQIDALVANREKALGCSAATYQTPTAVCNDGSYSYSQNHSGTCSYHGGVSSWLY